MASDNQDLTLTIKANTADAQGKIEGLGGTFSRLTGAFVAGNLITGALQKTFGFLENTVSGSIDAWNESERVVAQLNAVLASTQHAAGMSAQELIELSKTLQTTTTFSDEAVLSVENLLLTFRAISGPVLKDATATVLDMATALGEDTKSAAIQLGKALQDPILGVTALRRVGVDFNNSQKDMIEKLVKTGDALGAQKIILQELNAEFGGSAVAAAKTFEGQMTQVKNKINDVQEGIGHGLVAALDNAFVAFNKTTDAMNSNVDLGKVMFRTFGFVTEAIADTTTGINYAASALLYFGSYVVQVGSLVGIFSKEARQGFSDFRDGLDENSKSVADFALTLHDENEKTLASWDKIVAGSGKVKGAVVPAYEESAKAAKEAADKINDVNKSIADTSAKLADLIEGHDQSVADNRKAIGEEYIAEQQRINDLRKQIGDSTEITERIHLQNELDANLKAFAAKKDIAIQYAAEVAEATRRASETEFERNLEDIHTKEALEQKSFLKKELAIYQEMALEDQKMLQLKGNEVSITSTVDAESKKRTATVTASVDAQVAQYARLAAAATSAYSSSTGTSGLAFTNPNANFFSTTAGIGGVTTAAHHEMGGFVNAPRGTEVPIIAHGGEEIIPAEQVKSRGGNNVTIVIQNPSVRNNTDIDEIRKQIEDMMRPLLLNAKIIHI